MMTPAIDIAVENTVSNATIENTASNAATAAVAMQLCASCERCRARKTKCDGQRPCGNCVTRYMKINKCEE